MRRTALEGPPQKKKPPPNVGGWSIHHPFAGLSVVGPKTSLKDPVEFQGLLLSAAPQNGHESLPERS